VTLASDEDRSLAGTASSDTGSVQLPSLTTGNARSCDTGLALPTGSENDRAGEGNCRPSPAQTVLVGSRKHSLRRAKRCLHGPVQNHEARQRPDAAPRNHPSRRVPAPSHRDAGGCRSLSDHYAVVMTTWPGNGVPRPISVTTQRVLFRIG
jgi:hypothetical protein